MCLPPNMYPLPTHTHGLWENIIFSTGLQQLEFVYLSISEITIVSSSWHSAFVFMPSNKSSSAWQSQLGLANIHSAEASPHILLLCFFPKLGRCWCVRRCRRQTQLLEAEAKFTSPLCLWCRSASSVVMVTCDEGRSACGARRPGTVTASRC